MWSKTDRECLTVLRLLYDLRNFKFSNIELNVWNFVSFVLYIITVHKIVRFFDITS